MKTILSSLFVAIVSIHVLIAADGDSCTEPAASSIGINNSPRAPFWYTYTMQESNKKLVISSVGYTTEDTELFVFDSCNGTTLAYSDDYSDLQSQATITGLEQGESVIIYWTSSYSSASFNWELSIQDVVVGDGCEVPATAVEGINSAPYAPYWYAFTMPESGKSLVISSVGHTSEDTELGVFDSCNGDLLAYSDDHTDSQSQVTITGLLQGQTIYILWTDSYSSASFNWELSIQDVVVGDGCEAPATAVEGINSAPYAPYWYAFTMPESGKSLVISSVSHTSEDTELGVFDSCNGDLLAYSDDHTALQSQVTITGLLQGQTVYILWTDYYSSAGFNWELTVAGNANMVVSASEIHKDIPLNTTTTSGFTITNDGSDNLDFQLLQTKALKFDGIDDYISFSSSSSLSPSNGITVSTRIKLTEDLDCDGLGNWRNLFSKGWGASGAGYDVVLEEDGSITWSIGTENGGLRYNTNNPVIEINTWTHLVFTYSASTSQAKIFMDGEEIVGTYWESGGGLMVANFESFQLSNNRQQQCPDGAGAIPGIVDDLAIWDYALSAEEVRNLTIPDPSESGLMAYWDMESESGLIFDQTTNENHGYNYGAVTEEVLLSEWVTASPTQGTVGPGGSTTIELELGSGLDAGRNYTKLTILSNDPDQLSYTIPIIVNVTDPSAEGYHVTIEPAAFKATDEITITFNAAKGNRELLDANKVYMHSSVDITESETPWNTAWVHFVGNWGQDDGIGEMTQSTVDPSKWSITLIPSDYYGISEQDVVTWLAAVFRSADGTVKGTDSPGDIGNGLIHTNGDYFIRNEYSIPLSSESTEHGSFIIYPSPATDRITITNEKGDHYSLRLLDIAGRELVNETNLNGPRILDVSTFQNGIYLLELLSTERRTFRILKQ